MKCAREVFEAAMDLTMVGTTFNDVMKELDSIYGRYGFLEERIIGYTHGVGLQVEEAPITTIVPKHRFIKVAEGMALSFVHSPLMLPGIGQVKYEETFLVGDGGLHIVTQ